MSVTHLIPRHIPGGGIMDVSRGHPEVGGFDVILWTSEDRDEGMMLNLPNLKEVRKLHASLIAEGKRRGHSLKGGR